MNRRAFLKTAFGAACATAFARNVRADNSAPFLASDRILLGPRKIECSRLFLGTGSNGWNHSSNQTRQLGLTGLAEHLHSAFDAGITSWDSADQYGSHPHLARALADGVPRDKVTILTKTHAATADEMRADIARFQRELGTKTIDILLLHCLIDHDWPTRMRPVMDVIDEFQQQGIVRSKGVSCHSLGALKAAAKEPWVEIDLARINPHGAVMDAAPTVVVEVLREMKAGGKGVIGMKILGAGQLAGRSDECLRYVLNLDCVDAITIGCESIDHREDIAARISRAPRDAAPAA